MICRKKILTLSFTSLMAFLMIGNARAGVFDTIKEIGKTGAEIFGTVKGQATSAVTEATKARGLGADVGASKVTLMAKDKDNRLLFFIVMKIEDTVKPNMYDIYVPAPFYSVAKACGGRLQYFGEIQATGQQDRQTGRAGTMKRVYSPTSGIVGLTLSEPMDLSLEGVAAQVSGGIFSFNMNLKDLKSNGLNSIGTQVMFIPDQDFYAKDYSTGGARVPFSKVNKIEVVKDMAAENFNGVAGFFE